ncbi:hypothetical protein ANANG_G00135470, partial [Anguilla anguilla]
RQSNNRQSIHAPANQEVYGSHVQVRFYYVSLGARIKSFEVRTPTSKNHNLSLWVSG